MITNFKLYEKLNDGVPEVGDYVICGGKFLIGSHKLFRNAVINNIGKIINYDSTYKYTINYNYKFGGNINYYTNLEGDNNYYTNSEDILYWSKDKKELEQILQANKFNI